MRKLKWFSIAVIAFSVLLAGCNQGEEPEEQAAEEIETPAENATENEQIVSLAETFIHQLSEGEYEQATESFDETMTSQITAADLEEVWVSLNEQVGSYIDQEYQSVQEAEEFQVVLITGIFEDTDATFQVTVNEDEQIAGFYVQ